MYRTKYIVDKVSGKFDIDGRYANQNTYDTFKPAEVYFIKSKIHKRQEVYKRAETDVD